MYQVVIIINHILFVILPACQRLGNWFTSSRYSDQWFMGCIGAIIINEGPQYDIL